MDSTRYLSPKELAAAIGVSESSVKRWADDGRIQMSRTAGGHRRIAEVEAIRFVRDAQLKLTRPELLGISAAPNPATAPDSAGDPTAAFESALLRGDESSARAQLFSLYMTGTSAAALCDGILRDSLTRIGALWKESEHGIFLEHRAVAIVQSLLSQLRQIAIKPAASAPALGGAIEGDPSQIPGLMAEFVLATEGFRTVNLGPNIPVGPLLLSVAEIQPRLVWLSVNHLNNAAAATRDIRTLAAELAARQTPFAVGGSAAATLKLPPSPGLFHSDSMVEFAAWARGVFATQTLTRPSH